MGRWSSLVVKGSTHIPVLLALPYWKKNPRPPSPALPRYSANVTMKPSILARNLWLLLFSRETDNFRKGLALFIEALQLLRQGSRVGRRVDRVDPMVTGRVGPDLDEALEGPVRDELFALEGLHRGWARVVAVFEPLLDVGPVVGYSYAKAH